MSGVHFLKDASPVQVSTLSLKDKSNVQVETLAPVSSLPHLLLDRMTYGTAGNLSLQPAW